MTDILSTKVPKFKSQLHCVVTQNSEANKCKSHDTRQFFTSGETGWLENYFEVWNTDDQTNCMECVKYKTQNLI